jgi:hypothetical protein
LSARAAIAVAAATAVILVVMLSRGRHDETPVATPAAAPVAGRPSAAAASPARAVDVTARLPPPAPELPDDGQEVARHARDDVSPREARRLVEHVVKTRLGRDLGAADYDRLTDAVLRLRTASRRLRTAGDASPAVRERERGEIEAALADMRAITGLSANELGGLFGSDEEAAAGP